MGEEIERLVQAYHRLVPPETPLQGTRKARERQWRAAMAERHRLAPQVRPVVRAVIEARVPAPPSPAEERFHLAVEEFASSALTRLHDEQRRRLGARSIRPWDLPPALANGESAQVLGAILARPDRAQRAEGLEAYLLRWPRLVMAAALAGWLGQHPGWQGIGQEWERLWMLYLPSVDWTGLETIQHLDWLWQAELIERPGQLTRLAVAGVRVVGRQLRGENSSAQPSPDLPDDHEVQQAAGTLEDLIFQLRQS